MHPASPDGLKKRSFSRDTDEIHPIARIQWKERTRVVRPLGSLRSTVKTHSYAANHVPEHVLHPTIGDQGAQVGHHTPLLSEYDNVSFKELIRPYRRYKMTYSDWIQHRSEERYLRYMSGIFVSEVFRGLWKPVLFFVALTLLFGGYSVALTNGLLPSWLPLPKIGIEAFSISIPVLSFLLVFRTNSAFQRWDESRRHWGLVANRARDLARMGTTHIHNPLLKDALIRWVQAFTWALKGHCRPGEAGDLRRRLDGLLSEEELSGLEHAKHRPAYCIQVLSRIVARARLPSPITLMFDRNLTEFHDITGACERILRTPIYLPYTRNTTRWLLLWLFCLPFALFTSMGFYAVPAVALIAFLLMGVEEIGVQIEEPFSILPLENICDVTCQTIKEIRERFPSLDTPVFSWESEADGLQRRDGEEGDGSSDGASSSGPAYAHTTARAGGGGVAVRAAAAGPVRPSSPSSYFKEEENYDVGVEPRLESSPWAA